MNKLTINSVKIPKLKPSYQAYADSILRCQTQRQSALNAGFAIKTADTQANRMSKNAKVIAYIEYHRALLAEKNSVTLEDVIPTLRQIRDDNKTKRPQVSVQACAELSKIGRLYTDQVGADSRPAFVGISINMVEGTVKMVSDGGNSGGTQIDSSKDKTETINVTGAIK